MSMDVGTPEMRLTNAMINNDRVPDDDLAKKGYNTAVEVLSDHAINLNAALPLEAIAMEDGTTYVELAAKRVGAKLMALLVEHGMETTNEAIQIAAANSNAGGLDQLIKAYKEKGNTPEIPPAMVMDAPDENMNFWTTRMQTIQVMKKHGMDLEPLLTEAHSRLPDAETYVRKTIGALHGSIQAAGEDIASKMSDRSENYKLTKYERDDAARMETTVRAAMEKAEKELRKVPEKVASGISAGAAANRVVRDFRAALGEYSSTEKSLAIGRKDDAVSIADAARGELLSVIEFIEGKGKHSHGEASREAEVETHTHTHGHGS